MKAIIKHSDNKEFGTQPKHFSKLCSHAKVYPKIDICATPKNTKCKIFITKKQDAFKTEFKKTFWGNIPFGSKVINPKATKQLNYGLVAWCQRAYDQHKKYNISGLILLPLSSSIIAKFYKKCEIIIIENRITFLKPNNKPDKFPISKDLMCLVFRSKKSKYKNKKLTTIKL